MAAQILVVEDDISIRDMLVDCLADEGYSVAGAGHGAEALHYLKHASPPRMILLDLAMPVMNGWEFWQAQQSDPSLAAIPVVVLSADRSVMRANGDVPGILALPKPIELEMLFATVARFVR